MAQYNLNTFGNGNKVHYYVMFTLIHKFTIVKNLVNQCLISPQAKVCQLLPWGNKRSGINCKSLDENNVPLNTIVGFFFIKDKNRYKCLGGVMVYNRVLTNSQQLWNCQHDKWDAT